MIERPNTISESLVQIVIGMR